jgi:type IV pilus assembly protein PilC
MELVLELNEDPYFAKKLELCKASVSEGMDLSKALISSGIFSGLYARMASIGNKSGTLDQVMSQIAENYQDEADTKINQMLSVIEPTLVIVLSLLVGVILLSVMFPLIGIMSSL